MAVVARENVEDRPSLGGRAPERDARNRAIVEALHNQGRWAPSITLLDGVATIRCAIVNHRTTERDIDAFFAEAEAEAAAATRGP